MPNPEDISDPTTAMNMALVLMAKAFKLNSSTPTNNNQRISSNPRNRQIAQPVMNMGQHRQMQMVGSNSRNQFGQYAGQIAGNQNEYNAMQNARNQVGQNAVQNLSIQNVRNQNRLIVVSRIANQNANQNRNGNVVAPRAETQLLIDQKEETRIQLQDKEFDLMAAAGDIDKIEENDKAPIYDSNGSSEVHHYKNCYDNEIFHMFTQEEQYTELLEPITKPHPVQQDTSNVIIVEPSVEHNGGIVEQHPSTVEKIRAYYKSLYNNLVTEVEKVNTVNRKMKETNADLTTELARYKGQEKYCEFNQEKFNKLESGYKK
ncbi:hypothetical protein Tco_0612407 [Tanacetum coccineum]